jgi:hypothetical protein
MGPTRNQAKSEHTALLVLVILLQVFATAFDGQVPALALEKVVDLHGAGSGIRKLTRHGI